MPFADPCIFSSRSNLKLSGFGVDSMPETRIIILFFVVAVVAMVVVVVVVVVVIAVRDDRKKAWAEGTRRGE